jgi:hypothetical protein
MATSEEKRDLLEDILRPIKYYKISLYGVGVEYSVGTSTKEEYDYWVTDMNDRKREFDLTEQFDDNPFGSYMTFKDSDPKWDEVPANIAREFEYYDYTNVDHIVGPTTHSARLIIEEVDTDNSYHAKNIKTIVYDLSFKQFCKNYEVGIVFDKCSVFEHQYCITTTSRESGTFISGIIESEGKIDFSKLVLYTTKIHTGDTIVYDIAYDNNWIFNDTGDTESNSILIDLIKVAEET